MHRRRALAPLAAAALAGAALAGHASAATLHADPASVRASAPCDAATPCTLEYALASATSGDDVALAPGDYYRPGTTTPLDTLPEVRAGVVLHGTPGGPAAVLHGLVTANARPFLNLVGDAAARDLEVRSAPAGLGGQFYAYGVSLGDGGLLERVVIRQTGVSGVWGAACALTGGTVRDSVCLGDGGTGRVDAVDATNSTSAAYAVRNVTAVTTAPSGVGLRAVVASGTSSMTATNVIARGTSADVESAAGLAAGHMTLTIDHSNWVTQVLSGNGTPEIVVGLGDQHGAGAPQPLLVDAARGDFRQRAGSPTIDAGAPAGSPSELALGGAPRTVGATADIGADEFVPIPASSPPPPAGPTAGDRSAPSVTALRVVRLRSGARLRLTLSEAAALRVTLSRAGRRGRMVPLRARRLAARAGTGALGLGRLAPGRYRVVVTAADAAGNRSVRTLRFAVTR